MRLFRFVGIVILCAGIISKEEPVKPLYFDLPIKIEETYEKSKIGELLEEDWIEPISLELITDPGGPLFYQSNIRTTVCDDEVCEIMHIKLYWDLVGDYVGYDTVAQHPLTKFDHEPFTEKDYDRLHELLNNDGSILKFKQKSELIDKEKVKASDVVDGTTGATALEIKEEVVEGALYSSYTLWHLAYNGDIKNILTNNTKSLLDDELMKALLNSNRSGYNLIAFHSFADNDYLRYKNHWLNSLKNGIPLTRKYILKNIPDGMWNTDLIQDDVCAMFDSFDVNTKTSLLIKLSNSKDISSKSMEYISRYITTMNRNQTRQFLNIIKNNNELTEVTRKNVREAAENTEFNYAYLVNESDWDK